MRSTPLIAAGVLRFIAIAMFACIAACGGEKSPPPPPEYAQESWFEEGPLELHAAVDTVEIDTVGAVRLRFDARLDAGYALVLPDIDDKLGEFTVADIRRRGPTMTESGSTAWSLDLTLEPYLPGEYEIPSLEFGFAPVADGTPAEPGGTITTRSILVTVTSVLDDQELALPELRDVVDPETEFELPIGGVVIAGVIGLGLIAAIVLIARKLQLEPLPPSPVTEALHRLQVLSLRSHDDPEERASTLGEVSELIRRCIAHRGDPRAMRMSERELRRSMSSWPGLDAHEHVRLAGLLKRLDEARFAGRNPAREETADIVREAIEMLPVIERAFVHFSIAEAADREATAT